MDKCFLFVHQFYNYYELGYCSIGLLIFTVWVIVSVRLFRFINELLNFAIHNVIGKPIIYIYIFTNLLPTSIHGDKEKKKKSPPEFRDNNISNHCLGKKEKDYREKKKRKGQLCHTSWKKSRDMQSVGQKNKNPPQNAARLQLQRVLNTK